MASNSGHNQGAHHDPDNASGAIYPYAYGYQDPYKRFRTVMAFNCPGGCSRVNYFSNPDVLYNNNPTGDAAYSNNARTLNETAPTIANFQQQAEQTAPSAPSALEAAAMSDSEIDLDWTDTSSDETGFTLERSKTGSNFTQIASLPANTTSYRDDSLDADTLYYYRARAFNSAGYSAYSETVITATDTAPLPNAPTGLRAAAASDSEIDLNWTDASDDETGFRLERSKTGTNFKQIASLPAGTSGYRDGNLDADTRYYYRARSVTNAGYSTYSGIANTATNIAPPPSAPSNLDATATGTDRITLSWVDNSDSESGFTVYSRPDGSSSWTQIATTGADGTTYTDTGLTAATRYYYRVKAYNDSGQSSNSNADSAQTYDAPLSKYSLQQSLLFQ